MLPAVLKEEVRLRSRKPPRRRLRLRLRQKEMERLLVRAVEAVRLIALRGATAAEGKVVVVEKANCERPGSSAKIGRGQRRTRP